MILQEQVCGSEYNYLEWIRVTIGTDEENKIFIAALKEVLK